MAHHGLAVFSKDQTRGKGQREKEWLSAPGNNIALSVVIEPLMPEASRPFLFSMATALAVYDLLADLIKDNLSIKWPNDLYWNDRKAAGILIENQWQGGEWKFAVIGIGINVNQSDFGSLDNKAVSILQITGKENDPLTLAKRLCEYLERRLEQLKENPGAVISTYNSLLYRIDQIARFRKGSRVFDARVIKVDAGGELLVEHGVEESFSVGDVEWII
jgi:BirA family biotin operon repressor/biotin-[acetyl-CoA-carboxylase] ligase